MYRANILHVYPQLNCGGTEMVIFNLIKFSDHNRFSFSILVQRPGEQDRAFEGLGCQIITIPFSASRQYYDDLLSLFKETHFTAVHTHMHNEMGMVLKAAKEIGIKHRIAHSHNARIDLPKVLWPLRVVKHFQFERYATDLFGCSELALQWLFPFHWRKGKVIYNAIDLESFVFNENKRICKRKELDIPDSTQLIINVGRCTEQKNQGFIIDRAKDLEKEDCHFLIIGEGPLLNKLERRVKTEGLCNINLLGKRFDVADWLSAADVFVLPSLYEGLGIVAIEAQAAGLVVVTTDTIPKEADMGLGIFNRLSLGEPNAWNTLLKERVNKELRQDLSRKALNSDYNIHTVAKYVCDFYLS